MVVDALPEASVRLAVDVARRTAAPVQGSGWVKRCPNPMPGQVGGIEIRKIFAAEDYGDIATPEVRAIADVVGEVRLANSPGASRAVD